MIVPRSLFSRLENERAEPGNINRSKALAVEIISVAIITSKPRTRLTCGIPNMVANVFGMDMTSVIHVNINISHVRIPRRLLNLSLEAINCTIAVIMRSSCFSMLNRLLSNFSSVESLLTFLPLFCNYNHMYGYKSLSKTEKKTMLNCSL